MNRDNIIGLLLIGLVLGGIALLASRPVAARSIGCSTCSSNARMVPITEAPRYRNKETRTIEWNSDGLPVKIEITRDYTVA